MSKIKEQAEKWIADSGDDTDELQLAAQIMRDQMTTIDQLEQCNARANDIIKRETQRGDDAHFTLDGTLTRAEKAESENKRLRELLIEPVCRLYDAELITGSRACELMGGIKAYDFRELYTEWQESV